MRAIVVLTAALAAAVSVKHAGPASIRLAQTSTVTNCMMTCNSQAATCQTTCLVPTTGSTTTAATGNATLNTACQATCTTQQISCQTTCARTSPSQ